MTFDQRLRLAVKAKYKRQVSAARLARDLHHSTQGAFCVSSEAVRKWLCGQSKPRFDAICVLESFLGCRLLSEGLVPARRSPDSDSPSPSK